MPEAEEQPAEETPSIPELVNEREAPKIENWAAMRATILSILGAPYLCVELSMEQLNTAIQDAIEYIHEYWGKGTFKDVMSIRLRAGQRDYKIENEGIMAALEIVGRTASSGAEDSAPFALERMIAKAGSAAIVNSQHNSINGQLRLADIEIMNQSMRDWEFRYSTPYVPSWNDNDKTLTVEPTPDADCDAGLVFYRREKICNLFSTLQFRRLAAAYAGKQWALNWSKFNMALPGGSQMNTPAMLTTWSEEVKTWEERIRKESATQFIVG
jgi:hypothetical protein